MEKEPPGEGDNPNRSFHPKVLLIWLAILAAIVGLMMVQSDEIKPNHRSISTVNELLVAAKEKRVESATIQSDAKGGEECVSAAILEIHHCIAIVLLCWLVLEA